MREDVLRLLSRCKETLEHSKEIYMDRRTTGSRSARLEQLPWLVSDLEGAVLSQRLMDRHERSKTT